MVCALDSGSSGPGLSPGRVIVLCSQARHFTLSVLLFTQVYKWVPAIMLGGNPAMDQHPIQGVQQYSQLLHAKETRVKRQPHGPLGPVKALTPWATWACINWGFTFYFMVLLISKISLDWCPNILLFISIFKPKVINISNKNIFTSMRNLCNPRKIHLLMLLLLLGQP